jgi:hypothetical protein
VSGASKRPAAGICPRPDPYMKANMDQRVDGHHAHAATGQLFSYRGRYLVLGPMVDWSADVQAEEAGALARICGSIRLSRGQTRSVVPSLVTLMVAEAIDALQVAKPVLT